MTFLLAVAPLAAAQDVNPDQLAATLSSANDVPNLAVLLRAQIHALPDILLKVKDAASLKNARPDVDKTMAATRAIFNKLKTLPEPSAVELVRLADTMQARDAAYAQTKHAAMMQQLEKLPPDLQKQMRAKYSRFFNVLDEHGDVAKKYFMPDQTELPALPAVENDSIEVFAAQVAKINDLKMLVLKMVAEIIAAEAVPLRIKDKAGCESAVEAHGLTGADLARRLDVSPSLASRILSGERQLTTGHVSTLARHFGISPAAFLPTEGH